MPLRPTLAPRFRRSLTARPAAAAAVALALLVLPASGQGEAPRDPAAGRGQARGRVTDPSGAPVAGVSIVLIPDGSPNVIYATATDEEGRYAFNGLLPDTYSARADAQGFVTRTKDGVVLRPPFRPEANFQMEPIGAGAGAVSAAGPGDANGPAAGAGPRAPAASGEGPAGRIGEVEGLLRDAGGEPVLEGALTLRHLGPEPAVFYARTDDDGWFALRDLPAGRYEITTRSPGLLPLHLRDRSLPAGDVVRLRLTAPGYPLSFEGWLDDLLPEEEPVPPPLPRPASLEADRPAEPS